MSRTKTIARIEDLHADPHNANMGTDRGKLLLAESLKSHGAGRSVLVDKHGRILAGNKTVAEAKRLGLPIEVVRTDGTRLVVVQRRDLDLERDPAAKALAIKDNRVAELDLAWDPQALEELRIQGVDLASLWTSEEWESLKREMHAADPHEDSVLEPRSTDIKRGDFFRLGPHRLLCGDATDVKDVDKLLHGIRPKAMITDPPYGVNYEPSWRHKVYPNQRSAVGRVMNDSRASWQAAFELFAGDILYGWHAGVRSGEVAEAITNAGFEIRAQIIWVKSHFTLGRGAYQQGHEPCFYAIRKGRTASWHGGRTQSTVWNVPNLNPFGGSQAIEDQRSGHGTQKPVRLFEIPILNHLEVNDVAYDPFVGSGTTIVAAHKTGRVAFAMDLDPVYVQVAIDRWQSFAGEKARLIGRRSRG
jgi:DNA modification methylase